VATAEHFDGADWANGRRIGWRNIPQRGTSNTIGSEGGMNTTPHLNRSKVKQTALEIAGQTRAQGFTRVGKSFLERIEARTRAAIADEVKQHPSKGKTLL
jgi:hypothetical protein